MGKDLRDKILEKCTGCKSLYDNIINGKGMTLCMKTDPVPKDRYINWEHCDNKRAKE